MSPLCVMRGCSGRQGLSADRGAQGESTVCDEGLFRKAGSVSRQRVIRVSPLCVMRGCRVRQQDRSVPFSYSITCRDCWKAHTPPSHVIAMCTMWRAFSSSSCGSCHAHLFLVTTGHCWRPASACYQPRTSQGHCSWQLFSSPPYASRFVDSSPSQRLTRPCCMHVAMSESYCMHVAMLHADLLHANHACLSLCSMHVAVSLSHVAYMLQSPNHVPYMYAT